MLTQCVCPLNNYLCVHLVNGVDCKHALHSVLLLLKIINVVHTSKVQLYHHHYGAGTRILQPCRIGVPAWCNTIHVRIGYKYGMQKGNITVLHNINTIVIIVMFLYIL